MIRDSIKKVIKSSYLPMLILSFSMWLILLRIGLIEGSDDTAHLAYLSQNGILKWLFNRIVTWQPRIFSDLFFALLINHLTMWKIVNATVLLILMISISKISSEGIIGNDKFELNFFACCIFYFISPYVITSSIIWFAGSFNYLWSVTVMIITIIPFCYSVSKRSIVYKNLYILFILATICASYNEQSLAVIFCFGTLCILYLKFYKMKISRLLLIQYILILVNAAIFIGLSQISDRMSNEMHWYNGFEMLSIVDKIFQGINWTNFHYINSSNLLMLILTIEIYILLKENDSKLIRLLGMIPVLFFIFRILPFDIIFKNININNSNAQFYTNNINPYKFEDYLYNYFYNAARIMPNSSFNESFTKLLPSFCGFFIMLLIPFLLWFAIDKKEDKFLFIILHIAALMSGYIVGFSPTIFASGSRIFFVGNILFILVTVKLFSEILKKKIYYSYYLKYVLLGVALLFWFQIAFQFTGGILWL